MGIEQYFRQTVGPEAFDLFAVFSRFEFAMKRGGFRQQQKAEASWRRFGETLGEGFFVAMQAAPKAQVLFLRPPNELVLDAGNGVRWEPCQPASTPEELFDTVRRIRNNLFHGDKGNNEPRDKELIEAALFVLNEAFAATVADPRFSEFHAFLEYGL